jgi:Concanavalin A-like lectin/glucanases superfamily
MQDDERRELHDRLEEAVRRDPDPQETLELSDATLPPRPRRRLAAWTATLSVGVGVALLLLAAFAVLVSSPWHGPILLSLSGSHGIDTGDLAALLLFLAAVVLASLQANDGSRRARLAAGRWAVSASAVAVGALLVVGGVAARYISSGAESLVPAGGGTFAGTTVHADARGPVPVNRWSHLAVTYDGAMLRLYVNGSEVSSRATTGAIKRTTDPLWIGGNRPYGEYFRGLIDEVRVYDRVLSPRDVRADMARGPRWRPEGLVGAYPLDRRTATLAADASGNGNAGEVIGATWAAGRSGGALRFHGAGELVRVPAAPSLNLRRAMTLSAWIRPSEPQSGWRTVLARQTDAYFLMAGGGTNRRLGALDDVLVVLLLGATIWFCLSLGRGAARRAGGRRRAWWQPVALFLAGSLVDVLLAPTGTFVGAALVAAWFAVTASQRFEAVTMYLLTALFAVLTVASLAGEGASELGRDDGSVARSVAFGLLLVAAGLFAARSTRARASSGRGLAHTR